MARSDRFRVALPPIDVSSILFSFEISLLLDSIDPIETVTPQLQSEICSQKSLADSAIIVHNDLAPTRSTIGSTDVERERLAE